jgi:hypothetical protein
MRCAPGVTVPTLFIELTGDQTAFPADARQMSGALGAKDLTIATVRGLQSGGAIVEGEPTGNELAATEIIAWLSNGTNSSRQPDRRPPPEGTPRSGN